MMKRSRSRSKKRSRSRSRSRSTKKRSRSRSRSRSRRTTQLCGGAPVQYIETSEYLEKLKDEISKDEISKPKIDELLKQLEYNNTEPFIKTFKELFSVIINNDYHTKDEFKTFLEKIIELMWKRSELLWKKPHEKSHISMEDIFESAIIELQLLQEIEEREKYMAIYKHTVNQIKNLLKDIP